MKNANPKTWFLPIIGGNRYSAGAPFANLTASRLDAGDARSAALAVLSGGASALFDANFATGDTLAKTSGTWAFGASNTGWAGSISVVSNRLRMHYSDGPVDAWCEQRYTSGATRYPELWSLMRVDIPDPFVPSGGNSKGFFSQWENTAGTVGHFEDGYADPNGLFVGTELWPDVASGGWRPAIRLSGSGYDVNATSGGYYFPTGSASPIIVPAHAGKTMEILQVARYGTVGGSPANQNESMLDTTPGMNGRVGLWSRIPAETSVWTQFYDRTNMNMRPDPSVTGFNRGYMWGWVNGGFGQDIDFNIQRVRFFNSDPRGSI